MSTRSGSRTTNTARSCWRAEAASGSNEYLFAKQDRANIEDDELKAFRSLAKAYAALAAKQVEALVAGKDWIEICTDKDLGKPENRR